MKCTCAAGQLSRGAYDRKTASFLHVFYTNAPPRNCAAAHTVLPHRRTFYLVQKSFPRYLQTVCKCAIVSMAQNEIVQVMDTNGHLVSLFSVTWKVLCQQSEILHAGRVSVWGTLFLRPAKGGSRVLWQEKTIRMKRSD